MTKMFDTILVNSYVMKRRKLDVSYLINGVLGALVAICGKYNK